ncbi:MAG: DUF4020 domain-containing protein [bacterium]|nr:DUF4020 domain-containing protein [bacterium]
MFKGGKKHRSLVEAIEKWAILTKQGSLDHKKRIVNIVSNPNSIIPEDQSYLREFVFLRDELVRYFCNSTTQIEWLKWVEKEGFFQSLFDPYSKLNPVEERIADWFSRHYVIELSEEALDLVRRNGCNFNQILWRNIAHYLWHGKIIQKNPTQLSQWLIVLLNSEIPENTGDYLDYILASCKYPINTDIALILFDYLLTPRINLGLGFNFDKSGDIVLEKSRFETFLSPLSFYNQGFWGQLLRNIPTYAVYRLETIFKKHLTSAYFSLKVAGSAYEDYDPSCLFRTTIAENENHRMAHDMDLLIDGARDLLEWFIDNNEEFACKLIDEWYNTTVPILKRLATYGMERNNALNAEQKLKWILDHNLIWSGNNNPEVYSLLKNIFPKLSDEQKGILLDKIELGFHNSDSDLEERERSEGAIGNLLVWLRNADRESILASQRYSGYQSMHPDFKPYEYLDQTYWQSGVRNGTRPPKSVDELLTDEPKKIIDWLIDYKGDLFNGPNREGLLYCIREASKKSFSWGWQLVKELENKANWTSDIWRQVIYGFRDSTKNDTEWELILEFLQSHPKVYLNDNPISELLSKGIMGEEHPIPSTFLKLTKNVAESVLNSVLDSTDNEAKSDTVDLQTAINRSGGKFTELFIYCLARERREIGESMNEIPEEYRRVFISIITKNSLQAKFGRVILTSQINYLFWLDSTWTRNYLISLLDWSKSIEEASIAWSGFLSHGRWTEGLLPDLMPLYRKAFKYLPQLGNMRHSFANHMANLAVFGSIHPIKEKWLLDFIESGEDTDRKEFASSIKLQLESLDDTQVQFLWKRWLKQYWDLRLKGKPKPLGNDEIKEMIEWLPYLKPVLSDAIDRIVKSEPPVINESLFYRKIIDKGLVEYAPDAIAKLLLHLLPVVPNTPWICNQLKTILDSLSKLKIEAKDLEKLRNHASRLGCLDN